MSIHQSSLALYRSLQRSARITSHARVLMNVSRAFENAMMAVRRSRPHASDSNVSVECLRGILAEFCGRLGSLEGFRSPWSKDGRGSGRGVDGFKKDVDTAVAYLNYRHHLVLELREWMLDKYSGPPPNREYAASLLAAVSRELEDTSSSPLDFGQEGLPDQPLLWVDKLLELYHCRFDTSQLPLGIADPLVLGSLKKEGINRNLFFQFFLGLVLKNESESLYESMPVLTRLMADSKISSKKSSVSDPPPSSDVVPDYARGSILRDLGVGWGVGGDGEGDMTSVIDDSVFSASLYHRSSLTNLIEYSRHHPMMFVANPGGLQKPSGNASATESTENQQNFKMFDQELIYFGHVHRLQWLASRQEDLLENSENKHVSEESTSMFTQFLRDSVNTVSFELWHNVIIVIVCCASLYSPKNSRLLALVLVMLLLLETFLRVLAKGCDRC